MWRTAVAVVLLIFFFKRRSRETDGGGEKNDNAAANHGRAGSASGAQASTESHGVATSSGYDYEVFLSFRGPDTRANFTDHLYTNLKDAGIRTFKDDEDLRDGEEFAPKLLQAIKQSKILIPIFSKDYATSVWCLKEVVEMVKCMKSGGQKIIPIFYDVEPAEVRHQTGGYKKAFLVHERKKRYNQETIGEWKAALREVGNINGRDLESMLNRREGEFVKTFTHKVFNELRKASLAVSDHLVNVDNHVDAIMEIIGARTSETRIIGIHGMGGVGKTTIAKIIFNKFSQEFEYRCFLSNIREMSQNNGIQYLQNRLISEILKKECMEIHDHDEGRQTIKDRLFNKKVLLFLDDVGEDNHIYALVGNRDWLGEGSKIIITTRRIDVLNVPEVDHSYELTGMDPLQSFQLFSKHAFRRDSPLDDYIDQSNRAIKIAGGLPLALEVIGSLLCRTKKEMWDVKLEKLESVPHADIQSKLRISFDDDALDDRQRHIFLDIASLFIGYNKDILVHFWDESEYFPKEAMEVLQNMSLIKIDENNEVQMHDQLRDFGREIVRGESKMEIEKRSRVWNFKEAFRLLNTQKGETKVEALHLKFDHEEQYRFTWKDFKRLANLKFLRVDYLGKYFREINAICAEETLFGQESPSNGLPTDAFQENSNLLPRLRWLSWHCIPPTFIITNFSMEDVVVLDISKSDVTHDWHGWTHLKVMKDLKVLNLTDCHCLERTPSFSAVTKLEHLILKGCSKLIKVDGSICQLKCLVSLDVRGCANLRTLPDELGGLEVLNELRIDRSAINEFPNCQAMKSLRTFTASSCEELRVLPSIGDFSSLEYLNLKRCNLLKRLPDSIGNLASRTKLNIGGKNMEELPDSIGKLKKLKIVEVDGTAIRKIPDALWTIEKLEEIKIEGRFSNMSNYHVNIGDCICRNQYLRILRLSGVRINVVPRLPESLISLKLNRLYMDTFPDVSNLAKLEELELEFWRPRDSDGKSYGSAEEDPIPRLIGKLSKLKDLDLACHGVNILPTDIGLLPRLSAFKLWGSDLRCLPTLPSSLLSLHLDFCKSLCSMDLSNLKKLSSLEIYGLAVSEIQGLHCLENLQSLKILYLDQMKRLPDLSNLNKLRRLQVGFCGNVVEIQCELPQSLEELGIQCFRSLQKLPDLSSLMRLQEVFVNECDNLVAVQGNLPQSLKELKIKSCKSLQMLSDLSSLKGLQSLVIHKCGNLVEIQDKIPQSLEELEIDSCESLQKLSDLSSSKKLRKVVIRKCRKLVEIQGELPQPLEILIIQSCKFLHQLPRMSSMMQLQEVYVSNCRSLAQIQGELPLSLETMKIYSCGSLQKLPDLSSSMGLREIHINHSSDLVEIQGKLPQSLEILKISYCNSLQKLSNMSSVMELREIITHEFGNLVEIRDKLQQSLEILSISFCGSLQKLFDLSNLVGLRKMVIEYCEDLVEIRGELPQSLQELHIASCGSLNKLLDLSSSMALLDISISACDNLVEIQGELPQSLERLRFVSCKSLQKLPDLSRLMGLRKAVIDDCGYLVEIQGGLPQSLEELEISSSKFVQMLPYISSIMGLRRVVINKCHNLVKIQEELPQSLQTLKIYSCNSLQKLPDLSNLMELRKVIIHTCDNLVEIQGELPHSLEELDISFCESLKVLPNLSTLKGLQRVSIYSCKLLDVKEISLLCSENSVDFDGGPFYLESEVEDYEFESKHDGEDESEYESKEESQEFEAVPKGEEDKSESDGKYDELESVAKGEDDESAGEKEEFEGDDESKYKSEEEDEELSAL